MQSSLLGNFCVLFGILAGAANAQGVTEDIYPPSKAPEGCQTSYAGQFEITVIAANATTKRGLGSLPLVRKRNECGSDGVLVMTLSNSVTKDALARTGYIASNYQFQFDKPAQAGALYTAGFSLCSNGLLALGDSTQFWQCKSGDFWNLYDRNWAEQCDPVVLQAMPCGSSTGGNNQAGGFAGQIVGTNVITTTIVRPIADGQPQVITTVVPIAMCQIGDGQVQAHTTPCASVITTYTTGAPISQITDGQIQVPPPASAPATTPAAQPTPTPAPGVLPPSNVTNPVSQPSQPTSIPSAPPVNAQGVRMQWGSLSWAASMGAMLALALWL